MQKFNGSLIRQFPSVVTGNAAVGVQVSVYLSGTSTLASLFEDNETTPKDNPLTTIGGGFYSFKAADAKYRLEFSDSNYQDLEIQLIDADEFRVMVETSEAGGYAIESASNAEIAESSAALAVNAADVAMTAGWVYGSVASGEAARVDGEYFWVVSAVDVNVLDLYLMGASTATATGKSTPSSDYVNLSIDLASKPSINNAEFEGNQNLVNTPIITDESGRVLLEVDELGRINLSNSFGLENSDYGPSWSFEFHNVGDPSFDHALIYQDGKAFLAWDAEGNLLTGAASEQDLLESELMPYVVGSVIHAVGAEDVVAADVGSYSVLSTAPAVGHVRAVISKDGLSSIISVAAFDGYIMPDSTDVIHVVIGLGQSLMVGSQSSGTLISTTNQYPNDSLMFERVDGLSDVRMGLVTSDGAGAPALDANDLIGFIPLVARVGQGGGSRGQTPMESMAGNLAKTARNTGSRYQTLSFTAAMGGTAYSGLKKGTQTYTNMLEALTKAKALAESVGKKIIVDACLVKHGEADQSNASYLANLIEWQSDVTTDVQVITGQMAPVHFIMGQPSSHQSSTPQATIAMVSAHLTSEFHHLSGSDYPYLSAYASDYLHFLGSGYFWIGEMMAKAYKEVLWTKDEKSKVVIMTSAIRTGTSVVIDYDVPFPPLVFDTTTITERDVKGFTFNDNSGVVGISNASVTGPAQVTLTLSSTPSGVGEQVKYAMSPQSGTRTLGNVVRGNVRDSSTLISDHTGLPLYNWAISQVFDL